MRISDWSSDVCSSDLFGLAAFVGAFLGQHFIAFDFALAAHVVAASYAHFQSRLVGLGRGGVEGAFGGISVFSHRVAQNAAFFSFFFQRCVGCALAAG